MTSLVFLCTPSLSLTLSMELRLLLLATIFLSPLLHVYGTAACFPPDRHALRQFAAFSLRQNRTIASNYRVEPTTAFVGWEGDECCSWHGVVCNADHHNAAARISKLLLPNQHLVGTIPKAICSLSALSTLNLSSNDLTGSIPTCLAQNLTNLRHLDLSSNDLTGSVPTCLAQNLTDLRHLDLSYNMLTGSIPTCFAQSLTNLRLSQNFLTGSIFPTCFAQNLTNQLRHLNLSFNGLNGTILTGICSLSGLSTLDLSWNYLTGSIPTCFAHNLTNLRHLALSDNFHLNGTMLSVSTLPHLTYLDLSGTYLNFIPPLQTPRLQWLLLSNLNNNVDLDMRSFFIPVFTNSTPNLQHLDLSCSNGYLASGISNLFAFPLLQLKHLDLSYCWLTGELPVTAIISQAPQLRTLFLKGTLLAAEGSKISELLCGLKSLEMFSLAGDTSYLGRSNFVGEMPQPADCKSPSLNLSFLDLSDNNLGGPFPAWLSLFSNLQVLNLFGNNFDSAGGIPPEWQNLTHLTVLHLSGPTNSSLLLPQPLPLFRLPLQILTLGSVGLANQHIPCSQLSLLNATLQSLDFSNNLLTGRRAWHCLADNNFTSLASLDLSQNALAFNLGLTSPPSLSKGLNLASCQMHGELTNQFFEMLRSIGRSDDAIDSSTEAHISLGQNSFSGTLPLGIGRLEDVNVLDLSYNDFTGSIPASIGNMSHLLDLYLENNHLGGEVPRELGNMSLRDLFLGNNKLTKWHPATYSPVILDLSYNRLEGDLEQTFFGPHSLLDGIYLLLGHNRLTGAIPHTLFNGTTAPNLCIIQLSDNHLSGTIPHTLFKLFPSLTRPSYIGVEFERTFKLVVKNLELSYDERSGIFTYLDLSNNKLNGSIPESLGQLSKLMYLNLSRNQLTGNIPSSLSNLSLLEFLDLSHNRLQGSLPPSLTELTKLEVFNVSFNKELSGPIPTNSPQLEQNTSYIGDPKLCGEPYLQRCSDMGAYSIHHPQEDNEIQEGESFLMKWIDEWIAIPGFFLGILVGFLGALWVLRSISFI